MNTNLENVVRTSIEARDRLLAGNLSIKEANSTAALNHNIVSTYALDLRERIFAAEMTATAQRTARGLSSPAETAQDEAAE